MGKGAFVTVPPHAGSFRASSGIVAAPFSRTVGTVPAPVGSLPFRTSRCGLSTTLPSHDGTDVRVGVLPGRHLLGCPARLALMTSRHCPHRLDWGLAVPPTLPAWVPGEGVRVLMLPARLVLKRALSWLAVRSTRWNELISMNSSPCYIVPVHALAAPPVLFRLADFRASPF